MKDSEIDIYIDRQTPAFPMESSSFVNHSLLHDIQLVSQPRHDFHEEIPIKAVKLGLRLNSNLRKTSDSHNHALCKSKHSSNTSELLDSKNALQVIEASKKELRNSRFYRAAMIAEREIDKGVRHADLLYLAGEARRNMNHFNQAEDCLLEALSMQVYNPYCLYSLALVYSMQGKYDKAIPVLVDFLEEDREAYYELAKCYSNMKNYNDAIGQFSRYLDLCNDAKSIIPCLIQRAEAYEKINRHDLAVLDYRLVRQLDPHFHEPYIDYAESLEKEGLHPQAIKIRKFVSKLFI